mgnify:CR=1 FL=1
MPSMTKEQYRKFANEFLHKWEQQLATYHAYTLARQIKEWERVASAFEKLIQELSQKTGLYPNQIFRLDQYKEFMELSRTIADQYAKFNVNLTGIAMRDFGNAGMTTSTTLLKIINPTFSRLPVEAINRIIGTTSEGSPLYDIFKRRFDFNAEKASNALIEGIARGLNPNQIARNMRTQLDISIYDSTRITRTESLNVYRDVAYNQYIKSGIVDSYLWIAESDACDDCLEMEKNNPYPIDKVPSNIHPFDRCTVAPNM